jgi:YD repeat-containing protein
LEKAGIAQDNAAGLVLLNDGQCNIRTIDLQIPGRGFNWKFERSYRNGVSYTGLLGNNWDFNYNRKLHIQDNSHVILSDGYLRVDTFTLSGKKYECHELYTIIRRREDGTLLERDRYGNRVWYDKPNQAGICRMQQTSDKNDNTMKFEYKNDQLTSVTDTLGRTISYKHNKTGQLILIEDFIGRKIKMEYDPNFDLICVSLSAVQTKPPFLDNSSVIEKKKYYNYSHGFAHDCLNHKLISVLAPNEAAIEGPPNLEIHYDMNSQSPTCGRIMRVMRGGKNKNGIDSGGTISYEYQHIFKYPLSENLRRNKLGSITNVIDGNGNMTKYEFDADGKILRMQELMNRRVRSTTICHTILPYYLLFFGCIKYEVGDFIWM